MSSREDHSLAIHAESALLADGWKARVRLSVKGGALAAVEVDVPPQAGDERQAIVIPALSNLHSHAFQRAMAGLAEQRHEGADTFWSWRELMYRLAGSMTPEQIEAVANQAYVEMLETGFGTVGEFHYLHHDAAGRPYGDIAELAKRIVAAALNTGIGLTLLPVFYAHGTFGGAPPTAAQGRFVTTVDQYGRLLDECRRALSQCPNGKIGVAPHSLRAVTPAQLGALERLAPGAPIHIHIAEQLREVEDCVAWSGRRPIEWLLAHANVNETWCLVHATHMTATETAAVAARNAVVGLCPTTEANLGDGIFSGDEFMTHAGRYGIGTDSNVQIGAAEELRMLEYSQRLVQRARNVMARPGNSTGRSLFTAALRGGAQALASTSSNSGLMPGAAADMVSLDADHPAFAGAHGDALLDAWIFSAGSTAVKDVWVRGKKLVAGGRHVKREAVAARFRAVMKDLTARV